mmetsp:Transcript_92868/g.284265  ORF Transcript_92868/g.284265 Transcript_92868/m.284265 type:complete len:283 (+) Transcript_92868:283-1131(+)
MPSPQHSSSSSWPQRSSFSCHAPMCRSSRRTKTSLPMCLHVAPSDGKKVLHTLQTHPKGGCRLHIVKRKRSQMPISFSKSSRCASMTCFSVSAKVPITLKHNLHRTEVGLTSSTFLLQKRFVCAWTMCPSTSLSICVASSSEGLDAFAQGGAVSTGSASTCGRSGRSHGGGSGFSFFAQPPKALVSSAGRFLKMSSLAKEILGAADRCADLAWTSNSLGDFCFLKACKSSPCLLWKCPAAEDFATIISLQSLHLKRMPLVCRVFATKRAKRPSHSSQSQRGR